MRALPKEERKSRFVGIRFTEAEHLGLEYLAKQQGCSISQVARDLLFAGMEAVQSSESEGVISSDGSDPSELLSQLTQQLEPLQQLQERDRDLGRQLRKIQRSVDALSFMYLFHTPEIADDYKAEAGRHATVSYKKYDELRGKAYATLPNSRADTTEDT